MSEEQNIYDEMQRKMTRTYLSGIFIAINAIKGAYLLVDGPNCSYKKGEYIDKNHDMFSDLFDISGRHRIAHTDATPQSVINDRTDNVKSLLEQMARYEKAQAVFLCSMPAASLTGIHYDLITQAVQSRVAVPVIELPAKNMRADWLEAYEDVLLAIARKMPLNKKKHKKNTVAIVGYFMDRNEGDHTGNIAELKRSLKGLGLDLCSVWLCGGTYDDLQKVEQAGLIIALPYARNAAEHIALRTGAKLVHTGMPFGLEHTSRWLTEIARAVGNMPRAQKFIAKELRAIMPLCEKIVTLYVSDKRFFLAGDPYMTTAMADAVCELGGQLSALVYLGKASGAGGPAEERARPCEVLQDPFMGQLESSSLLQADISIGSSSLAPFLNGKTYVQFGFPSPGYHCFSAAPFLGYRGLIGFLNRIVNAVNSTADRADYRSDVRDMKSAIPA